MPTLSPKTIKIIQQTAPVLQVHAEQLTRLFYKNMFEKNPEVRPFFNPAHQASGAQQRALAGAIVAYATHIEKLAALGPAVELIAHKHASLGVRPEHYPIVGSNLLVAISQLLGDEATIEVLAAWSEAYSFLAHIFIRREQELYDDHQTRHGWKGFRRFRVGHRVVESDEITSFYLEPTDGELSGAFLPGQYLTIRAPTPEGCSTMRNYSLSTGPGKDYFRISVKREVSHDSYPSGQVSNWLHDTVQVGDTLEVGPPCGEFVLDLTNPRETPLVLVSGGVGITPLLSMLDAVVENQVNREVYFIHAARNGRVHAFSKEVLRLANRHPRIQTHICYDDPDEVDRAEKRFDSEGRIEVNLLRTVLPGSEGDFFLCGPSPMIASVEAALRDFGVQPSQIQYECFGPRVALT